MKRTKMAGAFVNAVQLSATHIGKVKRVGTLDLLKLAALEASGFGSLLSKNCTHIAKALSFFHRHD